MTGVTLQLIHVLQKYLFDILKVDPKKIWHMDKEFENTKKFDILLYLVRPTFKDNPSLLFEHPL